jgi:hypothetical protein
MSYFDRPPGEQVSAEFTVFKTAGGIWVAVQSHGLPGGVFSAREDALRFALREADGDPDRVRIRVSARDGAIIQGRRGPECHIAFCRDSSVVSEAHD